MGYERVMKRFELYITYISWGSGGKVRPVLVFSIRGNMAYVYPITTRYENLNEAIKAKYFKIDNWAQAGLDKQSYIDTRRYIPIPLFALTRSIPIGELAATDKQRLLKFLL